MKQTISVAIADDHPSLIKGLKFIVEAFKDYSVDIEASDGIDLLAKISDAKRKPDICMLDISMPNMDGFAALTKIRANWSKIKVIMQSSYYNEFNIIKAFREGAVAFMDKGATPKEINQILDEVVYKGYSYSQWIESNILPELHNQDVQTIITENEKAFLQYIATDFTYQQIADKMGKSKRTIEGYRDALFDKLSINSRTGLVVFAIRTGILVIK